MSDNRLRIVHPDDDPSEFADEWDDLLCEPEHVDWGPLQQVLPDEDDLQYWMWMYAQVAPDTGELVQHYKHDMTRGYLRLDRLCRPYSWSVFEGLRLMGRGGSRALRKAVDAAIHDMDEWTPKRVVVKVAGREPTS